MLIFLFLGIKNHYFNTTKTIIIGTMLPITQNNKLNIPSFIRSRSLVQKLSKGSRLYNILKNISKTLNTNCDKNGIFSAKNVAGRSIKKYCGI
jgi:hypothetical protein